MTLLVWSRMMQQADDAISHPSNPRRQLRQGLKPMKLLPTYSLLAMVSMALAGMTSAAHATCSVASQRPGAKYVNVGKLTIPSDATVGKVLFASNTITMASQGIVSCPTNESAPWQIAFQSPGVNNRGGFYGWVPNMPGVQWLGQVNSGLGIRWLLNGSPVTKMASTEHFATLLPGDAGVQRGSPAMQWGGRIQLEIVLVNPRPSKPIASLMAGGYASSFAIMYNRNNPAASTINYYTIGISSTTIEWPKARTCDASGGDVSISLGAIGSDKLLQVGDSSNSQGATIKLRCEGSPIVDMAIRGTNVAGHPELFGISSGDQTAGGVAVELLRNNQTIKPTESYRISTAAGSTLDIPISARYVRTGDLKPGLANATMTAAFTYN